MPYLYQAQVPLEEDKLKELKAKIGCEVRYEISNGFHNYSIDKNLSLQEIRMVEDYGLEFVIGIADQPKPTSPTPSNPNPPST